MNGRPRNRRTQARRRFRTLVPETPMPYQPILGTLGYVLSPDRARVLMVHRVDRPEDDHYGKYNGLGGKLERDEDVADGLIREIREESSLVVTDMALRGTINWTGFGPHGEDWLGFIFLVTGFRGRPYERNEDGPLEWVPRERLASLPMWEGDQHFLPLVFDEDPRPFHGFMPYAGDRPRSWRFTRL
jgi:8-oxo-dGTP diphosphatase